MKRCLTERELVLLREGEGPGGCRDHLDACLACASRYRRLRADLEVIGRVLAGDRPPMPSVRRRGLAPRWWMSAAAAAVAAVFVGGMLVTSNGSLPRPPAGSVPDKVPEQAVALDPTGLCVSAEMLLGVDCGGATATDDVVNLAWSDRDLWMIDD